METLKYSCLLMFLLYSVGSYLQISNAACVRINGKKYFIRSDTFLFL